MKKIYITYFLYHLRAQDESDRQRKLYKSHTFWVLVILRLIVALKHVFRVLSVH